MNRIQDPTLIREHADLISVMKCKGFFTAESVRNVGRIPELKEVGENAEPMPAWPISTWEKTEPAITALFLKR